MYKHLMEGLGVPRSLIDEYSRSYKSDVENLCHTHVVGVADPTRSLPPNTVFLTGVRDGDISVDKIFVTRSPCLEPEDGRLISVITTKPDGMSQVDWDWLSNFTFGAIIFANPSAGERPLPEIIADGDLDGDLYFVCWDKALMSKIKPIPITEDDLKIECVSDGVSRYDADWFDKTQTFISNVTSIAAVAEMTGQLFKMSEERATKTSIADPDAIAYAKAFKQALDYNKHGSPLVLPAHLLENVPAEYHYLFCSG
jgi:hypothetical protein